MVLFLRLSDINRNWLQSSQLYKEADMYSTSEWWWEVNEGTNTKLEVVKLWKLNLDVFQHPFFKKQQETNKQKNICGNLLEI